jgi:D-amino-acid dehydrogenase
MTIAIIGAGVVGLATALELRRRGHDVTLFDSEEPGSQTSSGNMALLSPAHVTPLVLPGFWKDIPSMLLDPLGPLAIRWTYAPALLPWFFRLLKASAPREVARITAALSRVAPRSQSSWRALLGERDAMSLIRHEGLLFVYRKPANLAAAGIEAKLRADAGVRVERLEPEAVYQMEPALARDLAGAYFYPDVSHVADPKRVCDTAAAQFRAIGGRIVRQGVRGLWVEADGRPRLQLHDGTATVFERAVIAAGIWSTTLTTPLGLRVPLESERGYHLMLPTPGVTLRRPVSNGDLRFMMTPLEHGLRLGGTAEFAGVGAAPNWKRAEKFLAPAQSLLPGLSGAGAKPWMGHRPSTPDSLPVIGPVPGHPRLICAFGHGHLGLTLGAITAGIVADCVDGKAAQDDARPFDPARFN